MILRPSLDIATKFNNVYKTALLKSEIYQKKDKYRVLSLRCSQLPFCGLSLFHSFAEDPEYSSLDLFGAFFTSVGTTVHTVMQTMLPQVSKNIYGDWKCLKCKKTKIFCSISKCCNQFMQYQEVSIDYKGIKGHIDCIYKIGDEFIVIDFKTTSSLAKAKKAKNPGVGYLEQISMYVYLLRKQYKIKTDKAMLMFIPRDNPKEPTYHPIHLSAEQLKTIGSKLKVYKRAHRQILEISTLRELNSYKRTFGKCNNEYCTVCKNKNVNKLLKTAFKKAKDNLPISDYYR